MHMIEFILCPERLIAHAEHQGHNQSRDEDLGYALHAWFTATLGTGVIYTFRHLGMNGDRIRCLAYCCDDASVLAEHAKTFAPPLAVSVCDWARLASKPMSDIHWQSGQRIGFEVRVCPTVRGKAGERDAFLASLPEDGDERSADREDIYREWMIRQLGDVASADPDALRMKAFRLVSTWRRRHDRNGMATSGRRVTLPDAVMTGRLVINEPEGFHRLLERGIGRHRSFGFGMLMARPA